MVRDSNQLASHVKVLPSGLLGHLVANRWNVHSEHASGYVKRDGSIYVKRFSFLALSGMVDSWSPSDQLCRRYVGFMLHRQAKGNLFSYTQTYRALQPKTHPRMRPLPEVISVTQPAGTNHLEVKYRITDADSAKVKAGLLAFKDGGNDLSKVIVPQTFIGSVAGKLDENTTTGTIHTVTWDAKADWNVSYGNVELAVVAPG